MHTSVELVSGWFDSFLPTTLTNWTDRVTPRIYVNPTRMQDQMNHPVIRHEKLRAKFKAKL